jgi:peptidylprolyl isomerase
MADLLQRAKVPALRGRTPLRLLCLTLVGLIAAVVPVGCGADDERGDGPSATSGQESTETTETSPAAAAEALEDTSVEPEIPRPAGSPPRRLETEDIVTGNGPAAKPGDRVTVHYVGVTFSTGEEFNTSWNVGRPYPFPLGGGQVIEGLDRGVAGMRKGGRRKLTIPPELAYGADGSPPEIGPNETLVYVVDLLRIRPGS